MVAALLTFRGASLHNENIIVADKFRPSWASFPFSIRVPEVTVSLTLPKWSTHRLQTVEPITKLITIGLLLLDGSYLYHSDVREENVDQLRLKFIVRFFISLSRSVIIYQPEFAGRQCCIQVFGVVNPTFHDLPAELLRQFHALFDPSRILAEAEPRPDRRPH